MSKTTFAIQSRLYGFPFQSFVRNSKIFKLTHLRAQIACYELKGDLSPALLMEIFHESFENFETTRICVENHASVTGWQKLLLLIQIIMLPTFGGLCNRYFWDIRLKMLRLLNFKMVFQLVLRKFFKSWSRDQVTQRAYWCKEFQKQPHPDKKRKKLSASLMGPFSNFLKAFYLSLQQIMMRLPP